MDKVAFYTLGCKVNQYETSAMASLFKGAGYQIVGFNEFADVYIINTCTVTNEGARKSRQIIRRAISLNPNGIIAVVGCYSQVAPDEVMAIPGVSLAVGTQERVNIVQLVERVKGDREPLNVVGDIMKVRNFEEIAQKPMGERTRAFVKIQEGCDYFCSYCIIPYARGPIRSRDLEEIKGEVSQLISEGFREVVLTGIHLGAYGKDLKKVNLLDVIRELNSLPGDLKRIRISSIEPTEINGEFVKSVKEMDRVCRHFHIPMQSGSNSVLKRMNRRYTVEEYLKTIKMVRDEIPDVIITTDLIIGFPGETEEEFKEILDNAKNADFYRIHVFQYSKRSGTPAAKMENQVSREIKEKRSKELLKLAQKMELDYHRRYVGKLVEVLIEEYNEDGTVEGFTDNYIRVKTKGRQEIKGEIVEVKITEAYTDYIFGEIV